LPRLPNDEITYLSRRSIINIGRTERGASIEIPSNKEYGTPCGSHRFADRAEIMVGIHDDGEIVCLVDTPAVNPGPED